ncbi:hypothetical protein POTOM_008858 [Populus tomentosa]|uniref:Uncharacterized protein n=1 Tax=Populus tomentosa TaxID=118781 RepID=A0A8X8DCU0_POPTO|nr:hypothetical protein POTOM_008858 [Populus tomentosa]
MSTSSHEVENIKSYKPAITEDELMRILVLVSNFLPGYHQVINEWNVAISAYRAYNLEGKKVGTVDLKAAAALGLTAVEVIGSNVVSITKDELMRVECGGYCIQGF